MLQFNREFLKEYQQRTFALLPEQRVKTIQEAVDFVNLRGFVFFWPISGIHLPNLWMAVAGDRPVSSDHEDAAHITWNWKDSLLGGREWYYAKILRKKSTMVSFDIVPFFYALSDNLGSYEDDHLILYEQGRMTMESKQIYEAILEDGPLDTVQLRRAAHLSASSNEYRFNRAISDLQADFKILPIGVTDSGAWKYAFAYEIVARHYPDIPEKAHYISENTARQKLIQNYVEMLGAVSLMDIQRLFGWNNDEILSAIDTLIKNTFLVKVRDPSSLGGELLIMPELRSGY